MRVQVVLSVFFSCVFLLIPSKVLATNKLEMEPFAIKGGETQKLFIDLENDMNITAVQFDLLLPEGLSIQCDSSEEPLVDITERTTLRNHSLMVSAITGGYRILLASTKNSVIKGSSGALIMAFLYASSSFSGGIITLTNIELVTPDEMKINPVPFSVSIDDTSVSALSDGDCNSKIVTSKVSRLDGIQAKSHTKGILIVGGRKVIK